MDSPDSSAPVPNAVAITPHDTNPLAHNTRGLYIGTAGDVKVDMVESGTAVLFKALAVGFHPLRVKKVYATDTTASDIVGVW